MAETERAIRMEEAGAPATLYFPLADVRLDRFGPARPGEQCPVKGPSVVRSLEGTGVPTGGPATGWKQTSEGSGGRAVLIEYTALEGLKGWATFDHDRVRVELVDVPPGINPESREASVKRFPTWGEGRDLADVIDVQPTGAGSFVSLCRTDHRRPVVEGSQMLGQAIVAAGRMAPGRRTVSGHMVFGRAADAARPMEFDLDEVHGGRTFSTVLVNVHQGGRSCARGTLLLDVTAPDLIRHHAPAPVVPGPYDCPTHDMSVTGRDIRVVEGAYTDDPDAPLGPPVVDAWVRFRDLPADPYLHAGLLAQFTGHMSIAASLRPHAGIGQRQAHRTISTAINAIAISMHRDVRADQWMLYHHESTFAGDGMTHSACRVYDEGGGLLASFSVDAMVRRFAPSTGAVDDRTAL